jgi:hypothetical protein
MGKTLAALSLGGAGTLAAGKVAAAAQLPSATAGSGLGAAGASTSGITALGSGAGAAISLGGAAGSGALATGLGNASAAGALAKGTAAGAMLKWFGASTVVGGTLFGAVQLADDRVPEMLGPTLPVIEVPGASDRPPKVALESHGSVETPSSPATPEPARALSPPPSIEHNGNPPLGPIAPTRQSTGGTFPQLGRTGALSVRSPEGASKAPSRGASGDFESQPTPDSVDVVERRPDRLSEEVRWLESARAALRAGDPGRALGIIGSNRHRLVSGALAPETLFVQMQAHGALGQADPERATARELIERFPRGPAADRARAVLGE